MFDVGQDDAGGDFLDARELREFFEEKLLVGFDVLCNDSQQEVDVAEHDVAIHHLRVLFHIVGESGQIATAMRCQFDVGKYHGRQTNFLAIEDDGLIPNHALLSHSLNAAPASRLR